MIASALTARLLVPSWKFTVPFLRLVTFGHRHVLGVVLALHDDGARDDGIADGDEVNFGSGVSTRRWP